MAKKKAAAKVWPNYTDTCEHIVLIGSVGSGTALHVDVGVDRKEVLIGLREDDAFGYLTLREVERLIALLSRAAEAAKASA